MSTPITAPFAADELDPSDATNYPQPVDDPSYVPLRLVDYSALSTNPEDYTGEERDEAQRKRKEALDALEDAVHNVGFFYLTNPAISPTLIADMWALGRQVFALPTSEKRQHAIPNPGDTYGWKESGVEVVDAAGTPDGHEQYNCPKNVEPYSSQFDPIGPVKEYRDRVEEFSRLCHDHCLTLLRAFSLILQIPAPPDHPSAGHFDAAHANTDATGDFVRWIRQPAVQERDGKEGGAVRLRGHTDFGSITLLFSQPISGLQLLSLDETRWLDVRPVPGCITVNVGDAIAFWSAGYLKATMHRVTIPRTPHVRSSLAYFCRPHPDAPLSPVLSSPLVRAHLERTGGVPEPKAKGMALTAGEWLLARKLTSVDKKGKGVVEWERQRVLI